jgi:hypothetical protein
MLVGFEDEAKPLWEDLYKGELKIKGKDAAGMSLARSHAHVRLLAIIYAALDFKTSIGTGHLESAMAVWRHSAATVRRLFPDQARLKLLAAMRKNKGTMTRTQIRDLFNRKNAGETSGLLITLAREGVMRMKRGVKPSGHKFERWILV